MAQKAPYSPDDDRPTPSEKQAEVAPTNPQPPEVPYSLFSKNERRCIVCLIALAGWFSTLSSFIYYPAISIVAHDLQSTLPLINLTVTSYLIVSGFAPSVVGAAADVYGRRPLYFVTLALYVVANVGIACQNSFVALLLLRMLQSAGISGTFSVAYGVIANIAAPSERGAFVAAVSCGITTAPSLGPVIDGALASGPGWRWIFWFLAIMSSSTLAAMVLALPETNRTLVGNGGVRPPPYSHPLVKGIMRPWKQNRGPSVLGEARKRRISNPIKSLVMLGRKDTAVSIIAGSILYMNYSCIHASLSSSFITVYGLDQLEAGLIYLPFGIGAIISTFMSSKWIDHDYRVTARAHGLPINRVSGDDLTNFPIEEARMRSIFAPALSALVSVVVYGWLVEKKTHLAAPLVVLFVIGWSIQTCFNINNTILVDINQDAPATAQASFNLVRCVLSGVFVAFLQEIIDSIGFGWTYTILGSLCSISILMYFLEWKFGRGWRLARHDTSM